MMKIRKVFTCPRCGQLHIAILDFVTNERFAHHFPDTYGSDRLICANCLPLALTNMWAGRIEENETTFANI